MSRQRERIRDYIASNPGQHFSEVTRALDIAPGQAQYHLRKLRRQGCVVRECLYGQTHYYTPEVGAWERCALALLRRETARDVLLYLLEHGPAAPSAVATGLGIARSTLEWHLDHLAEQDLVEKRRDRNDRVTLVLSRPEETARLLREVSPSLPDRLVDRFTKLVDSYLSE